MPYFDYKGKQVYYNELGQGQTLLLLPGNTASSLLHKPDIEYFSTQHRVICPDYLGYGKSQRVERHPLDFWWANGEMCNELLKFLNVNDCYAVGTSGGGIIALDLAIIAPSTIKGVIADSISGEYPNSEIFKKQVAARTAAISRVRDILYL